MIILGVVLFVTGLLLENSILDTVGFFLLTFGGCLALLGALGRPIGPRHHYF